MFKIKIRSLLIGLITALLEISNVLEDFWHITYTPGSCRYSRNEIFNRKNRCLEHKTFHVNRTRLPSPSVPTFKGRVMWNTHGRLTSLVQMQSGVPITIHHSIQDQQGDQFFV
ncbi:hypothetical protein TNCV_854831 [Trichonephila clavipes]|nr:hypothetical protein TNCV_854831 [Trichonephila clavipes]